MIASLHLKGFIPTGFYGVEEIIYTPEQVLQIIIGTNGSGKSSLLRACSLAPMDKREFTKDGYRKLVVHKHGFTWTMVSDYSKKTPHHEFWKDDENLNKGGTGAVQKELVEHHLGYTAFHHKLLTGKLKFTEMSPNARKDLLIMISGLELDYVLGLFEKAKVKHRDIVGASKHVISRYADVTKQLSLAGDPEDMERRHSVLAREMQEILSKSSYNSSYEESGKRLVQLQGQIKEAMARSSKLYKSIKEATVKGRLNTGELIQNPENAAALYEDARAESVHLEKSIRSLLDEQNGLSEQLVKFKDLPSEDQKQGIAKEVVDLKSRIESLDKEVSENFPYTDNLSMRLQDIALAFDRVMELKISMPDELTVFESKEIDLFTVQFKDLKERVSVIKAKIHRLEHRIAAAKSAGDGDVTCPKCSHIVLADGSIGAQMLAVLEEELEKEKAELTCIELDLQPFNAKQKAIGEFIKARNQLSRIYSDSNSLYCFSLLGKPSLTLTKLPILIEHLRQARVSCEAKIEKAKLLTVLNEKELILSMLDVNDLDAAKNKLGQLETKLNVLYDEKKTCDEVTKYREGIASRLTSFFKLHTYLEETLVPKYNETLQKFFADTIDVELKKKLRLIQDQMAVLNKDMTQYAIISSRVKELEKDEQELKRERRLLESVLHLLSPKKGLVAEQLHEVIGAVVGSVNSIVDKVWDKDLTLTHPEFGKNLDFQFFTSIEGFAGPDIKDLSDGQKEIVNFAMTLIIMRQLELTDFPLLLDETSANMDSTHRSNFMRFIKDLTETSTFKSIFLVSHYASEYGGFSNADIIVLNHDNISLPTSQYNKCIDLR